MVYYAHSIKIDSLNVIDPNDWKVNYGEVICLAKE